VRSMIALSCSLTMEHFGIIGLEISPPLTLLALVIWTAVCGFQDAKEILK